MSPALPIDIRSQHCWLSPERCLYWEEERTLILSDLHFGKTGHFRKAGIPVPPQVYLEDLHRLMMQVQYFQPETIIITGDLFHSRENLEHALFARWKETIPTKDVHLVRGNHDILSLRSYADMGIEVHEQSYLRPPFLFAHDPDWKPSDDQGHYRVSGHIHPGIRLSGIGKQSLRFPCFHFSAEQVVLPAFSKFTGLALVTPRKGDMVYAVIPNDPRKGETGAVIKIH